MSTRVIAIDWSGAKQNAAKKIWLAEFRNGQPFGLPSNGKDPTEVSIIWFALALWIANCSGNGLRVFLPRMVHS